MDLASLRQAATEDHNLVLGIDLVAAFEEHVELGRECVENAVVGLVRLDLQYDRAAQDCVAGVHETRIAINALGVLFL